MKPLSITIIVLLFVGVVSAHASYVTTCGYDATASLQNANGNATQFQYNSKGQLAKEIYPVGAPIRYEYDVAGRLVRKTNDSTGSTIVSYAYDVLGRVTSRAYADGTSDSFTYDAAGRLSTASNQNISYTFAYDGVGRLASQTDGADTSLTS